MDSFLPAEFEERMKILLGSEFDEFIRSYDKDRYRGLRLNPLKKDTDGNIPAIENMYLTGAPENIEWEPLGYYYDENDQPGRHPLHEAGVYYIQEPSAMAPAGLLGAKPGEKILDLCAAPGGKTTQIAGKMEGRGLLVANEINPSRARILSENVERLGISNAVVTNESPEKLASVFPGFFDRILVDAPCSGEGMFRKNEEALMQWSLENVLNCADRQAMILDCAAKMLTDGGRIVYSTCTFAPEEDEDSVNNFVARHPEFEVKKTLRLWPHKIKGEGHFAAVIEKRTAEEISAEKISAEKAEDDLKNKPENKPDNNAVLKKTEPALMTKNDMKKIRQLLEDIVREECFEDDGLLGSGRIENYGDSVYLVPAAMTSLKGLKVLRPGLCLGTVKKDRFDPSHSLALALSPGQACCVHNLNISEAADYIKGLTVNCDAAVRGWTLVCVDGFSLGWGKASGGVIKNHYPKGLRK